MFLYTFLWIKGFQITLQKYCTQVHTDRKWQKKKKVYYGEIFAKYTYFTRLIYFFKILKDFVIGFIIVF